MLIAVVVCSSMISSSCGSSPTQPTPAPAAPSSPPSPRLTIVGTTVLSSGAKSQLIVKDASGNLVTDAHWESQSPDIASVSYTGLVTANAIGATLVTAASAGLTTSASVVVQAPGSTIVTITACGSLTMPGRYIVGADLSGAPCLTVVNVAGIQIDCAGHATGPIVLTNVSNVTVSNCSVTGNVKMTAVTAVSVTGCTVHNGLIWAINGSGVTILSNTVIITFTGLGGAILLSDGSNNRVTSNTMTGGYGGGSANVGADDGIILTNETGDTIDGNTISDFYDAGIEGVNLVANATIANNTIANIGVAGISSYWCTAWTGNIVRGNQVSSGPLLLWALYESPTKCELPVTPAAFMGNQFIGNVFRNPAQGTSAGPGDRARMLVNMPDAATGNNLLQGNDFGPNDGPNLSPLSGFIDGGGNSCGLLNATLSNFPCSRGALTSSLVRR